MDPRHTRRTRQPRGSHPIAVMALGLLTALSLGAFAACNKHVFRVVPADCVKEQQIAKDLQVDVPADILVVVDNSGSMCEEQDNLVRNFFDPACPVDISQPIPERYKNPPPELIASDLADCGFIQILSLFEKDFRLGVITTDVSPCDNPFQQAQETGDCRGELHPDWGRKPQRGCLQPTSNGQKVLSNSDVVTGDIGTKFQDVLRNIQTFGSPFERGLDAVQIFLDRNSDRAPGCENDVDEFLRDDAQLVLIFLTDEEDCSHADGEFGFTDELSESDCEDDQETYYLGRNPSVGPAECYSKPELLAPVGRYVDFLQDLKGEDVAVAVIAGALEDNGELQPAGCRVNPQSGTPVGQCHESGGSSNLTAGNNAPCNPVVLAAQGIDEPCCEADPGTRYYQFARAFGPGNYLENSICYESFRQTMIDIASFIAAENFVGLAERPVDPGAIIVKITRAGSTEEEVVPRIPDGVDPTDQNGWQYNDSDNRVYLYGTALPKPGDRLFVAALDEREGTGECQAPDLTGGAGDAGP